MCFVNQDVGLKPLWIYYISNPRLRNLSLWLERIFDTLWLFIEVVSSEFTKLNFADIC